MDSSPQFKFEKGKIYYLICFALVAGGKSTFYDAIITQCKQNHPNDYNVLFVSSDQIRQDLTKKYHSSHSHLSYEEAFEKVGKTTGKEFDSRIVQFIKKKDDNKITLVLVDKNYPSGIDRFRQTFCKDSSENIVLLFTPKITRPIEAKSLKLPFSYDYVFQCYLRLKGRKEHETLTGTSPNAQYIYLSFLKLFQNFVFASQITKGVYLKEISFSDESNHVDPSEEIKELFSIFLYKMKPFKFQLINDYQNNLDYLFDLIEKEYSNTFNDTRSDIVNEVKLLLENKHN